MITSLNCIESNARPYGKQWGLFLPDPPCYSSSILFGNHHVDGDMNVPVSCGLSIFKVKLENNVRLCFNFHVIFKSPWFPVPVISSIWVYFLTSETCFHVEKQDLMNFSPRHSLKQTKNKSRISFCNLSRFHYCVVKLTLRLVVVLLSLTSVVLDAKENKEEKDFAQPFVFLVAYLQSRSTD